MHLQRLFDRQLVNGAILGIWITTICTRIHAWWKPDTPQGQLRHHACLKRLPTADLPQTSPFKPVTDSHKTLALRRGASVEFCTWNNLDVTYNTNKQHKTRDSGTPFGYFSAPSDPKARPRALLQVRGRPPKLPQFRPWNWRQEQRWWGDSLAVSPRLTIIQH